MEPFYVISGLLGFCLLWNGILIYKFLSYAKGEGQRVKEATEQAFIIATSRHSSEAVDALSTKAHNQEAVRQAQETFNAELSAYKPGKQQNEVVPKKVPNQLKDQNGRSYDVESF